MTRLRGESRPTIVLMTQNLKRFKGHSLKMHHITFKGSKVRSQIYCLFHEPCPCIPFILSTSYALLHLIFLMLMTSCYRTHMFMSILFLLLTWKSAFHVLYSVRKIMMLLNLFGVTCNAIWHTYPEKGAKLLHVAPIRLILTCLYTSHPLS